MEKEKRYQATGVRVAEGMGIPMWRVSISRVPGSRLMRIKKLFPANSVVPAWDLQQGPIYQKMGV